MGKSSLIQGLWTDRVWNVDLLKNDQFLKYSKEPSLFRKEAQQKIKEGIKTIVIDEVQKLPALLDEVHSLIESSNTQFILTGSSARKLKRGGANLLAGRAVQRYLFPFTFNELREHFDLNHVLRLGSLPAIHELTDTESMDVLKTYTETYLKEEILSDGVARNIGSFSRFLDIAAAQCGEIVNYTNIGREAHVNARSVQSYYQILEDTLLGYFCILG
ncbi:MAG: AAA family ATPase [Deltaproteobacteria bacterium]|nr:MAG: AAA family ATPase [Deltaproteobacteria bacterium]